MTKRALILERDGAAGERLREILNGLGIQGLILSSAEHAVQAAGRHGASLALIDFRCADGMPPADLCAGLRKRQPRFFPILSLSKSGTIADAEALLEAGVTDCLPNPPPAGLLEKKIRRWLGESPSPSLSADGEMPEKLAEIFFAGNGPRLADIAGVYPGAAPRRSTFRRMAPPEPGWRGVLTDGSVAGRFAAGKPGAYLKWNRTALFRLPAPEEYDVPEKVVLRRSGPPLAAAVDRSRLPVGQDMYSIVPRDGVSGGFIACLLNSRLMDFYFNRTAGGSAGPYLSLEALRAMPAEVPGAGTAGEFVKIARLLAHFGPNPESWADRKRRDEWLERMDGMIFSLFGVGRDAALELAAMHF